MLEMRLSLLVICINLQKNLVSHYRDFQIQIVRVPEYSLLKHHVLECNTHKNYIKRRERTVPMHISHAFARKMQF